MSKILIMSWSLSLTLMVSCLGGSFRHSAYPGTKAQTCREFLGSFGEDPSRDPGTTEISRFSKNVWGWPVRNDSKEPVCKSPGARFDRKAIWTKDYRGSDSAILCYSAPGDKAGETIYYREWVLCFHENRQHSLRSMHRDQTVLAGDGVLPKPALDYIEGNIVSFDYNIRVYKSRKYYTGTILNASEKWEAESGETVLIRPGQSFIKARDEKRDREARAEEAEIAQAQEEMVKHVPKRAAKGRANSSGSEAAPSKPFVSGRQREKRPDDHLKNPCPASGCEGRMDLNHGLTKWEDGRKWIFWTCDYMPAEHNGWYSPGAPIR